jgi:hypothetical protein
MLYGPPKVRNDLCGIRAEYRSGRAHARPNYFYMYAVPYA